MTKKIKNTSAADSTEIVHSGEVVKFPCDTKLREGTSSTGSVVDFKGVSKEDVATIATIIAPIIVAKTLQDLAPVIERARQDAAERVRDVVNPALAAGFRNGTPECAEVLKKINSPQGLDEILGAPSAGGVLIEHNDLADD